MLSCTCSVAETCSTLSMAYRFTLWWSVHSVFVSILQAHVCPIDDDGLFKTRQGPMVQVLKHWMASPSVLSFENHSSNIFQSAEKKRETGSLVHTLVNATRQHHHTSEASLPPGNEVVIKRQSNSTKFRDSLIKHVEVVSSFSMKKQACVF